MSPEVALIIGAIAGVAAIILLYVKVLPKNADGNLNNSFLQFLHNYFHFKKLYIEAVLKFIFTLLTVFSMTIGFFMLFSRLDYGWGYSQSFFWVGFSLLVFAPIGLRITYELLLMTILLVQNVIDINRKMGGAPKKEVKPVVNNTPVNNVPVNNAPVNNVPPVNNAYPVNNGYPVNNAYQANNNVPPVNNNFAAGNDMYAAPQEQPQQFQQPQNPQW